MGENLVVRLLGQFMGSSCDWPSDWPMPSHLNRSAKMTFRCGRLPYFGCDQRHLNGFSDRYWTWPSQEIYNYIILFV